MKKEDYPTKIFRKAQYTAGDIAALYGVSHRTACKMIDTKIIAGHTVPGSKQRRVSHEALVAHVSAHAEYAFVLDKIEGPRK